jgi:hypothetical protein
LVDICSLTLIVVSQDDCADDCHLNKLLDNVIQAMVLVYGLDDLINIKNVERFKKEIKVGVILPTGSLSQAKDMCRLLH